MFLTVPLLQTLREGGGGGTLLHQLPQDSLDQSQNTGKNKNRHDLSFFLLIFIMFYLRGVRDHATGSCVESRKPCGVDWLLPSLLGVSGLNLDALYLLSHFTHLPKN